MHSSRRVPYFRCAWGLPGTRRSIDQHVCLTAWGAALAASWHSFGVRSAAAAAGARLARGSSPCEDSPQMRRETSGASPRRAVTLRLGTYGADDHSVLFLHARSAAIQGAHPRPAESGGRSAGGAGRRAGERSGEEGRSDGRTVGRSVARSGGGRSGWFAVERAVVGRSGGCSDGGADVRAVARAVVRTVGRTVGRSADRFGGQQGDVSATGPRAAVQRPPRAPPARSPVCGRGWRTAWR